MQQGTVADFPSPVALSAARISLELRVPMADSVMLATARAWNATLWSQDADFAKIPDARFVRGKGRTGEQQIGADNGCGYSRAAAAAQS